MKLLSFNVNGIRAIAKKSFFEDMETLDADIICLQETKANPDQVRETLAGLFGYEVYANSAERAGYSGTALLSKTTPLGIAYGMGIVKHDSEGRIITAEYDDFYLVNVYTPNSGSELARLTYREEWDKEFLAYLKKLEKSKPVVVCGDMNVAHEAIDLTHPTANYNRSAGYMQQEIDGMDNYIKNGFVDTFRYFYPERKGAYSWWSYRTGGRPKNVGWRIDYFLCSEELTPKLKGASIFSEITGSDHCPVGIEIKQ